jgi:hypothetical protein
MIHQAWKSGYHGMRHWNWMMNPLIYCHMKESHNHPSANQLEMKSQYDWQRT